MQLINIIIKQKLLKWCNIQGLLEHLTNKNSTVIETSHTHL